MTVSSSVLKNYKHAFKLAMKGSELGFLLAEMYCAHGNDYAKSYICLPILFYPKKAVFSPCCLKALDLVIERAKELGVSEEIINEGVNEIRRLYFERT